MQALDICEGVKVRQRVVILEALREGPVSSVEARERYGVLHIAGRVMELRRAGHYIETRKETRFDAGVGVPAAQAQERATKTLEGALGGVLMGDFALTLADGSNVNVGEALDDPERWHGAELKDPLEPEFQHFKTCAKLYLFGASPCVHSFARGGRTFKLRRQPARVYLVKGRKAETATELLTILEGEPDVFLKGSEAALVSDGDVRTLDRHALAHLFGTRVAFFTYGRDGDIPADLPGDVIEMLMSQLPTMKSKDLKALTLLPYARADGTVVDAPGYDARSGVYAHFDVDELLPVPSVPTGDEVVTALRTMWRPWSAYNFATDDDRGAMLSAIISAVSRPALDICPGFFFDAPIQASGKTRAAGGLGALMRGRRGGITPFVGGQGADAELVKKIVAMLRAAEPFVCIDNVVGHWKSPVLASLITDGAINERVLGGNVWYRGDVRLLVTATGNNGEPDSDLGRRFIRVRIDPRCERPQARDFDFDPVELALRERMAIASAVLVLIRAHRVAGAPCIGKGGAGFEQWSGLVRQAVLWAGAQGFTQAAGIGTVGDPAASILQNASAADPEVEAWGLVLRGVAAEEGVADFQSRDVLNLFNRGSSSDSGASRVREGLLALLGDRVAMTATRIGHALKNRRDRIVDGLVLRASAPDRTGVACWRVENAK